jgi:biopolymer transport protein ExbD
MSKKRSHRRKPSAEVNLGFQIAPMIDVVFVILLYFMVMAGDIQVEKAHNTKLPGTVEQTDKPVNLPDEIAIRIEDDGQVLLNDDPLDDPVIHTLPELTGNLIQLKTSSTASGSEMLVTIYANELAKYQRVIEVLDALTRAQVSNVTFQAGSPD